MTEPIVLIIEDGDEYLDSLSRFVPGPKYIQAHSGEKALEILNAQKVDLIYLDMRFDRIPNGDLMGDHVQVTRETNGDPERAWRHLQINQGLYILQALRSVGLQNIPVILAYDFSRQAKRFEHLSKIHPSLRWVHDAITPAEISEIMVRLIGQG